MKLWLYAAVFLSAIATSFLVGTLVRINSTGTSWGTVFAMLASVVFAIAGNLAAKQYTKLRNAN